MAFEDIKVFISQLGAFSVVDPLFYSMAYCTWPIFTLVWLGLAVVLASVRALFDSEA